MISSHKPEFKMTEVGLIPVDWDIRQVKDVASINEMNIDNSYSFDEIEYVDISSVRERRLLKTKLYPLDQAPTRAKRIIRNKDILISTVRPRLKHFVFIKKSKPNLVGSTGFAVISPKKVNPSFLYYYLTSDKYTKFLTAIASIHATTYPSFTPDVILNSYIPYPSIYEQKEIADIFTSLDAKINLNYKMIHTLESVGKTFFKHWFVDYEFPTNGGNSYRSSGGNMHYSNELNIKIPEGWNNGVIGDLVSVQPGHAFKSQDFDNQGKIGVIKIKNILDHIVDVKNTTKISEKVISKLDTKFSLPQGSILMAMTGTNVGKVGIVPKTQKKLWLNQRVCILRERLKNGVLLAYFILNSKRYQQLLKDKASGSAQLNISSSDIESIRIVLPPKEIIFSFGTFFRPFYEKIIENLYEVEKLSDLRDTLLPHLFSGHVRPFPSENNSNN
ncbi:MAG: restriction endonuclease subunit S [Candidatus Hodarchaeota archaeon]